MNKQYVTEQLMEKVAFVPALALAAPAIGSAASWLGSTLGLAVAGAALGGIINNVKDYFKPIQKGSPMPGKIHTSEGTPNLTKINPYTAYPTHKNTLQPTSVDWTNFKATKTHMPGKIHTSEGTPNLTKINPYTAYPTHKNTLQPTSVDWTNFKATKTHMPGKIHTSEGTPNLTKINPYTAYPTHKNTLQPTSVDWTNFKATKTHVQDPASTKAYIPSDLGLPESYPPKPPKGPNILERIKNFSKNVGKGIWDKRSMIGKGLGVIGTTGGIAVGIDKIPRAYRRSQWGKVKEEPIPPTFRYEYFKEQQRLYNKNIAVGVNPDTTWRQVYQPAFDSLKQLYDQDSLKPFKDVDFYNKYPKPAFDSLKQLYDQDSLKSFKDVDFYNKYPNSYIAKQYKENQ